MGAQTQVGAPMGTPASIPGASSAAATREPRRSAALDVDNLIRLGLHYGRQKEFARAIREFQMALAAKPAFPPALLGMARVLSWQGHYAQSLKIYDSLLRADPENGDAAAGKAFVLLWSKRAGEAEELFSALLRRFPQDAELADGLRRARAALAAASMVTPRTTVAVRRGESLSPSRSARNPKEGDALPALAAIPSAPSRCPQNVEYRRQALSQSPDDSWLSLARSLASCRQYGEAIERYRRYLKMRPKATDALLEMAGAMLRSRRTRESIEPFRDLVKLEPTNIDAKLGLAHVLAADGQYAAALSCYDDLLKTRPDNYDALQGKAFVLYWTKQFAPARAIFQRLAIEQPADRQNAEAVESIGRAEEESRWADLRPRPGAGLREFKRFYEIRLASYPDDLQSLRALADIESQSGDTAAAVRTWRRLTEADPEDADASMELARLLGLDGQIEAAMKVYRRTARDRVTNVESMTIFAGLLVRANRIEDAISIYRDLAAQRTTKIEYRLEAARLEASVKDYSAARQDLFAALSIDSKNWDARAQLAQLELAQGAWEASATHFAQLLRHDSGNLDAILGRAETAYYKGDLRQARSASEALVEAQPDNFDAVFLLANFARARGRQRDAQALLDQAEHLAPDSHEVAEMKRQFNAEPTAIMRTSIGYAREIGPSDRCPNPQGCGQLDLHQDLRTYSYGSIIETNLFPRTVSLFSFSSLPAASPLGRAAEGIPIPTGISGAVAPAVLLYRQTTQLSSRLSFRGGAGVVKFGPGQRVTIPGQPEAIISAGSSLLAQSGFSFVTTKKTSVDLDFSRSPVTFTPTSVRLGVVGNRLQAALNFFFAPRTELHMIAFYSEYSSERFKHSVTVGRQSVEVNEAVHQQARGGSVTFNQNLFRSTRFSFDSGLNSSVITFLHPSNQLPLGSFTPDLFQTHLATARFYGHLTGPLAYDFSGGLGIQQTERGGALTRATQHSPALTLRATNSLVVTLGYVHYSSAQSLGSLRGNAIRLTTEWKFK